MELEVYAGRLWGLCLLYAVLYIEIGARWGRDVRLSLSGQPARTLKYASTPKRPAFFSGTWAMEWPKWTVRQTSRMVTGIFHRTRNCLELRYQKAVSKTNELPQNKHRNLLFWFYTTVLSRNVSEPRMNYELCMVVLTGCSLLSVGSMSVTSVNVCSAQTIVLAGYDIEDIFIDIEDIFMSFEIYSV